MALRDYFFKRKEDEDERGRNVQVGYKQRETWFDRFLNTTGSILKYIGFTAVALTGIGAIALGTQYIRGSWPYQDVRNNEYVITQNAINEKPARPLKQGVNALIRPFVRTVKKGGLEQKVSGQIQTAESPKFMYRSQEGAQVELNAQYNWQVTSPDGAAKVYWDHGGIERMPELLDGIVEDALLTAVAKVPAKDIVGEYKIQGEDGVEKDFRLVAEEIANKTLRQERTGVRVTNVAVANPKYSPGVEAAWEAPLKAEQEAIARRKEADSEAEQRGKITESLINQAGKIQAVARTLYPNQPDMQGQYIERTMDRATLLSAVNEGARPFIFAGGGFGSQGSNPIQIINPNIDKREQGPKPVDAKEA